MARFLRDQGPLLVAVGSGVLIGTTATIFYLRSTSTIERELAHLARSLDSLRREVEELRATVQNTFTRRKKPPSFYSTHASSQSQSVTSGDEDEIYEEAYGGGSELTLNTQGSTSDEYQSTRQGSTSDEYQSAKSQLSLSSSTSELYTLVDRLLEGTDSDKTEAVTMLQEYYSLHNKDAEFLWRLSKATYMASQIAGSSGDEEKKKTLVYDAFNYAYAALELADDIPNVHKWCAITVGSVGDYEGTAAKIGNGYKFKEHIVKAISLDSKDSTSHYLLGRWCYGVYMLTWIERNLAATLYASPPTSTADEALEHFLNAESLEPGKWKDNMLYVAKCYIEKRDYYEAVEWLDKADNVQTISVDDKEAQVEIDGLLYKYSGYRR